MTCFRIVLLAAIGVVGASAQSFSFYSTLRAGLPNGVSPQVLMGDTAATNDVSSNFYYLEDNNNRFWRLNGQPQNFQIGWTAATNTAYVTLFNSFGSPITTTFTNPGTSLGPNSNWTIPASLFTVAATGRPRDSSISLQNLTFSTGVQVLSGALPSSISAAQTGTSVSNSIGAPIVINPASAGGDWYISGNIRFTGLITSGGIAANSDLRFLFGATGSAAAPNAVPEASTSAMVGMGLVAAAVWQRKTSRSAKSA